MDLRLTLFNLWLRLTVKTKLGRIDAPTELRALMEQDAARKLVLPAGSHFVTDLLRRSDLPRKVGMIDALWASCGRPDRRKVVLYFHGGAYLAGSPRTHRHLAAALSRASGVRFLVPDYRLAPEHPFPAALDDGLDAYRHLLAAGYLPEEIGLAGDSAGGGLALALSLRLEQEGLPPPACLVAFSPWTDLTGTSTSVRRNAGRDVMLPAQRLQDAVGHYLGSHDPEDPLVSPAFGTWQSPPPTFIMASRSEILLDDATAVADRLRAAGGDVRLELWRRMPHAWPLFQGRLAQADDAVRRAGAFIGQHLNARRED